MLKITNHFAEGKEQELQPETPPTRKENYHHAIPSVMTGSN
jgi:hypothetical protein